jgi:large subunit ribosomal protein L5e
LLAEDEPEKYQLQFSSFIKEGVDPENLESLYKNVHAAIRADPEVKLTEKHVPTERKRYVNNVFVLLANM